MSVMCRRTVFWDIVFTLYRENILNKVSRNRNDLLVYIPKAASTVRFSITTPVIC